MRISCVKNGLVVATILLFIGVAVQPSVASIQPKEIDVEPDVEGLVAQLRVAVNEKFEKYESIPKVADIWEIILNLLGLFIKILNKIVEVILKIIIILFLIISLPGIIMLILITG